MPQEPIQHDEVQRLAREAGQPDGPINAQTLCLKPGDVVTLQNEKTALVTAVGLETITLDANHGFNTSDVKFQAKLLDIVR